MHHIQAERRHSKIQERLYLQQIVTTTKLQVSIQKLNSQAPKSLHLKSKPPNSQVSEVQSQGALLGKLVNMVR